MAKKNRYIKWWLWTGAGMIFLMLIVGGITRLTGSGLSMTDWNLIMGAVPPANHTEWMAVFEQYKQFPQYQLVNANMTLAEFKTIFFWEYIHRLLGRIIGIVFLIPFLFFWIRGYFTKRTFRCALVLFGLGALQGGIGWFMVKSGLVNVPSVSHYRLALHLLLTFVIIGCCVWFALDINKREPVNKNAGRSSVKKWAMVVAVLFSPKLYGALLLRGLTLGLSSIHFQPWVERGCLWEPGLCSRPF